jgi:hypothetical protein
MRKCLLAAIFAGCLPFAVLAMPVGTAKREIDYLIGKIEHSGCRFERNGEAYDATQAGEHMRMKLNRAGDRIQTAENFIDGIASKSYLSGKPYRLLCPDLPAEDANAWLTRALRDYRQSGAASKQTAPTPPLMLK